MPRDKKHIMSAIKSLEEDYQYAWFAGFCARIAFWFERNEDWVEHRLITSFVLRLWEWMETKKPIGEDIYDYHKAFMVLQQQSKFPIDAIIDALLFCCWGIDAYERRHELTEEPFGDSLLAETTDESIERAFQNADKFFSVYQNYLVELQKQRPINLPVGDLLLREDMWQRWALKNLQEAQQQNIEPHRDMVYNEDDEMEDEWAKGEEFFAWS